MRTILRRPDAVPVTTAGHPNGQPADSDRRSPILRSSTLVGNRSSVDDAFGTPVHSSARGNTIPWSTRGRTRPYPRGVDADREWATRRDQAVSAHAADLARQRTVDAARAAELLREFVAAAQDHGLA